MKTLKKNWKNHEFSRCYLFFGEETYLIREYEAALRKAILPDGAEMMTASRKNGQLRQQSWMRRKLCRF